MFGKFVSKLRQPNEVVINTNYRELSCEQGSDVIISSEKCIQQLQSSISHLETIGKYSYLLESHVGIAG